MRGWLKREGFLSVGLCREGRGGEKDRVRLLVRGEREVRKRRRGGLERKEKERRGEKKKKKREKRRGG